jgi:hypothetical protein
LTACGQSPATDGRSEVAVGGAGFQDAGARTAKYGTDALPGVFPHAITHAMSKTTPAKKPTRVTVLDTGELDNVVVLGVQPVGVAFPDGSPDLPSYIGAKAGHAKHVPDETWYLGLGVLSANSVLTDLRATLQISRRSWEGTIPPLGVEEWSLPNFTCDFTCGRSGV